MRLASGGLGLVEHTTDQFGLLQRGPHALRLIREANARACTAEAALADLLETVQELAKLVRQGERDHQTEEATTK